MLGGFVIKLSNRGMFNINEDSTISLLNQFMENISSEMQVINSILAVIFALYLIVIKKGGQNFRNLCGKLIQN